MPEVTSVWCGIGMSVLGGTVLCCINMLLPPYWLLSNTYIYAYMRRLLRA